MTSPSGTLRRRAKQANLEPLLFRLSLELAVCVPLDQAGLGPTPEEQWPSVEVTRPLKFKGQEGSELAMTAIVSKPSPLRLGQAR